MGGNIMKNDFIKIMVIIGTLLISMMLLLKQCNKSEDLERELEAYKKEVARTNWNNKALTDSLVVYRGKNGELEAKKSALLLNDKEMKDYIKKLTKDYGGVVEVNKGTIISVGSNVSTKINIKTLSNDSSVYFNDSINWGNGNYRSISGVLPYNIKYEKIQDSIIKGILVTRPIDLKYNMGISILTGVSLDEKTGEPTIFVKSKNPDFNITSLEGATITNPEQYVKKKSKFGMGLSLGLGPVYTQQGISPGFFAGIGFVFIPKKLLF